MEITAFTGAFRAKMCGVLLTVGAAALTGCGIGPTLSTSTDVSSLGKISGTLYGGQQPINQAHIYVFAIGTGGYKTAAVSLLTSGNSTGSDSVGDYVTTGANGGFNIASAVSCTVGATTYTQAYLLALGGNTGSGTNSAVGLLAPLGACVSNKVDPPSTFVGINEVSTVVTAYALAGFAADATHIASSGTTLANTGVANAMATALNMLNLSSGTVPATSATGNAVLPAAEIYTLANALAACVNTAGPSSTGCQDLYSYTGTSSDTAAAAIAIAHAPFTNVSAIYTLGAGSNPAFGGGLASAPADLTLGLQYKTPQYGQNAVVNYSAAFDSGGNLWTRGTNTGGTTTTFAKYGPTGAQLESVSPAGTVSSSSFVHIGIDSSDNVWSGETGGEIKLSSTGAVTPLSNGSCAITGTLASTVFGSNGTTTYAGDLSGGHIWEFSSTACTGSILPPASTSFSGYLAVASNGDLVSAGANGSNSYLYWYKSSGVLDTSFLAGGEFLSTDASNNVWAFSTVGTPDYDVLNQYNFAGSLKTGAAFYQGGLVQDNTVTTRAGQEGAHIDGAGAGWVGVSPCTGTCSNQADIITGVATDGTGITPRTGLALPYSETGAHALALDGSGNLWVAVTDGSLIEYVGLTTPVATPVLYSQLGVKP